jgi:DNA replication and repair protein RecF
MYIKSVYLENFRNYKEQNIIFCPNINIIYGNNAQGKTNIIEAIYLCSLGKSFRSKKDKELINFNEQYSKIKINYYKSNRDNSIDFKLDDKKQFLFNDIKQNKISEIVGKLNIVTFTPDDINIIKNGPEERRKFINMMISSLRPKYLHNLNQYNKVLEERNNLLKQIKENNVNSALLDIYDEQLASLSQEIFLLRNEYIDKIKEKIEDIHKMITKCGNQEEIKIKYISSGSDKNSYLEAIKKSRNIDIKRGFSAVGIHRDDIIIYINHKPVNIFGSQGQQRTAVLSLKLCELQIVKEEVGESPVLLLDDFMSELDIKRRNSFLENIKDCQVILTCTDEIELNAKQKIFYVNNGKVEEV